MARWRFAYRVYGIEECREAEAGGISHFFNQENSFGEKNEGLRRSQPKSLHCYGFDLGISKFKKQVI